MLHIASSFSWEHMCAEQKPDEPIVSHLERETLILRGTCCGHFNLPLDDCIGGLLTYPLPAAGECILRRETRRCVLWPEYFGHLLPWLQVQYNINGWLDKNKDPIQECVVQLMQESKEPLVAYFFRDPDAEGQ